MKAACPLQHLHKLKLMMDYASHSDSEIVPDPYYGGPDGFDLVLDYIEDASAGLIRTIQQEADRRDA